MVFLSQSCNEISNEVSALLRIVRTHYKNDIKLQIMNVISITEIKLKVLRKSYGYYKFLFLVKIPKNYPCEPLWVEPVIICKQMKSQFLLKNFKSYKLRPLVDNVLKFCYKYEPVNSNNVIITYPSTKLYGDEHITTKVFVLINRALAKLNTIQTAANTQSIVQSKFTDSRSLTNDIDISILNRANIYHKSKNKFQKYNYLKKNGIQFKKKRLLRSKLQKGIDEDSLKVISLMQQKDIKYCKLNFYNVKHILKSILIIPDNINSMDYQEDLTIELGDNFRIHLKMLKDVLIVRKVTLLDFMSYVNSSYVHDKIKISSVNDKNFRSLLLRHSRQMISMNIYYTCSRMLVHLFCYLQQQEMAKICFDEEEVCHLLRLDFEANLQVPVFLMIQEIYESVFYEFSNEFYLEYSNIVPEFLFNIVSRTKLFFVEIQPYQIIDSNIFPKETYIQNALSLKGDFVNEKSEYRKVVSNNYLTIKCLEIMSEIVQYPTKAMDSIEYILDLNPLDLRHRVLIECIGIRPNKIIPKREILTSSDYSLDHFFLKEIINCNEGGFLIRLHKIASTNLIFDLLKEENHYYKNLLDTNRTVWSSAILSNFGFNLFRPALNMVIMYMNKILRHRLLNAEASELNCMGLCIQRCHFYREFVESIELFKRYH